MHSRNAVSGCSSLVLACLALLIISVCLVLNAKALDTHGFSNNTSNDKNVTQQAGPSKQIKYIKCVNSARTFNITYPSNWANMSGDCSLFTPNPNAPFSPSIEPFVRISVTDLNTSLPIPSISDIEKQVIFFSNPKFFNQISIYPPMQINASSFVIFYRWTGDPEVGLPYVNQSASFPALTLTPLTSSARANNKSDPFIDQLFAKYIISHNKIYVIEYSAPVNSFNDSRTLQDVSQMIGSFVSTGSTKQPNIKPAYCNEPINANSSACIKPAYCNEPINANSSACKQGPAAAVSGNEPNAQPPNSLGASPGGILPAQ